MVLDEAELDVLARRAYATYGDAVGWKNYQGLDMPRYDDLGEVIQRAWGRVAGVIAFAACELERQILEDQ